MENKTAVEAYIVEKKLGISNAKLSRFPISESIRILLSEQEAFVFRRRVFDGVTFEEIGEQLNFSRQRASQIYNKSKTAILEFYNSLDSPVADVLTGRINPPVHILKALRKHGVTTIEEMFDRIEHNPEAWEKEFQSITTTEKNALEEFFIICHAVGDSSPDTFRPNKNASLEGIFPNKILRALERAGIETKYQLKRLITQFPDNWDSNIQGIGAGTRKLVEKTVFESPNFADTGEYLRAPYLSPQLIDVLSVSPDTKMALRKEGIDTIGALARRINRKPISWNHCLNSNSLILKEKIEKEVTAVLRSEEEKRAGLYGAAKEDEDTGYICFINKGTTIDGLFPLRVLHGLLRGKIETKKELLSAISDSPDGWQKRCSYFGEGLKSSVEQAVLSHPEVFEGDEANEDYIVGAYNSARSIDTLFVEDEIRDVLYEMGIETIGALAGLINQNPMTWAHCFTKKSALLKEQIEQEVVRLLQYEKNNL